MFQSFILFSYLLNFSVFSKTMFRFLLTTNSYLCVQLVLNSFYLLVTYFITLVHWRNKMSVR